MRQEWGPNEESTFILYKTFTLEEIFVFVFAFFLILVFARIELNFSRDSPYSIG